jgi:V8-like Glu-specific endopeptidase
MTFAIRTFAEVGEVIEADAAARPGANTLIVPGERGEPIRRMSTGGAAGELLTVLGDEDRQWIRRTEEPWFNMICQIAARSAAGDVMFGTGFLVGRRTVVTAAHVVRQQTANGNFSAKTVRVVPGRDVDELPYGGYEPEALFVHPGWMPAQAVGTDIAVIRLTQPVRPVANAPTPGRLGLGALTDTALADRRANIAGYPKSFGVGANQIPTPEQFKRLYWHENHIPRAGVHPDRLLHQIDTDHGQSGSPLVLMPTAADPFAGPTVVGIHTLGEQPGVRLNVATRLTAALLRFVHGHLAGD